MPSWELLCGRQQSKLTRQEVNFFNIALRIYNTKAQVNKYNYKHLVNNNKPAIQVTAVNCGKEADKTAADKAGNLHNKIPLYVGARIMLTRNLWQDCSLVNSAQGYVFDLG